MTVIIFVLTWNIERASSQDGKISPRRLKFYGLASIPLMLFLYTIIWHVEIGNTWVDLRAGRSRPHRKNQKLLARIVQQLGLLK
jgi:hypothetical protein